MRGCNKMICQKSVEIHKQLIISADDLNHTPEINDGIGMALDAGTLTSMSVIVNRPLLPSTEAIIARRGGVSLGIHFNLSRYRPCSDSETVRTLTVNWCFEFGGQRGYLSREGSDVS